MKENAADRLDRFKREMAFKCYLCPPLHHPIGHKVYNDLKKSNVLFHTVNTQENGFWGVQFIFPNKAQARKAAAVLGKSWEDSHITRYYEQYGIAYYQ